MGYPDLLGTGCSYGKVIEIFSVRRYHGCGLVIGGVHILTQLYEFVTLGDLSEKTSRLKSQKTDKEESSLHQGYRVCIKSKDTSKNTNIEYSISNTEC
jgi:hypothetical protein